MMFLGSALFILSYLASSLDGQALTGPKHGKVVVCYLASWAEYRPDAGMYNIEDLDPDLCTHIVYSFAGLNADKNSIESLGPWQDLEDNGGRGGFKRLVAHKQRYPHLKVLISIGGWNEGSTKYSMMAANSTARASFVRSVVEFLILHHFDGLDLHWKYPTMRGGQPQDKNNLVLLAKQLKKSFEPHDLLLTMATGGIKFTMDPAYDFVQLNNYVDYFHMLCYDYHGVWDGVVGANAPLKTSKDTDNFSVDFTIKYMLSHGVSPSKMVLGLAAYGRAYQLKDPSADRVIFGTTPVQDVGFMGPYTREAGFLGYNEICLEKMNTSWSYHWDEQTLTPYLRDDGRIISYDNPRSIAIKVKAAIDYDLSGFMIWAVDTDDFRGKCFKETDTYVDFKERFKALGDDPATGEAFKKFNKDTKNSDLHQVYVITDGKLEIRLPESERKNPILRTINDATTLALEEKITTEKFFKEFVLFLEN